MPLINVRVSTSKVSNPDSLLKELSAELAKATGKPEKYVMSLLQTDVPMTFGGTNSPCCYVVIKSIGELNSSQMTKTFCNLIESKTAIPASRIYINFENVTPNKWGFNGQTFG